LDREFNRIKLKTRIAKDFQDNCFHLLTWSSKLIFAMMINEGNKQKGQSLNDPTLFFDSLLF